MDPFFTCPCSTPSDRVCPGRPAVATESKGTSTTVSTWMVDHRGRLGAVNLGPFVGVDFNMRPTVYIAVIVTTRT